MTFFGLVDTASIPKPSQAAGRKIQSERRGLSPP
jgi:hypothetical protein